MLGNAFTRSLGLFALLLQAQQVNAASTPAASVAAMHAQLPPLWQLHLPLQLSDDLMLGEIRQSCPKCPEQQSLAFFNLRTDKPYRVEKISLQQRYSAYYHFPGSHVFVLLQLEQSLPSQQVSDSTLVGEAFRHDCQLRQKKLALSMEQQPQLAKRYRAGLLAGRALLEFQQQSFPTGELLSCNQYSTSLPSQTISQLLWLRPQQGLRIRMSFSQQDHSYFSTLAEFVLLQQRFIQDYQLHLTLADAAPQHSTR
jgi:hypothetical protein